MRTERTYRQVVAPEPKIAAFLQRHRGRLDPNSPPRGLWVCEQNGEPIIALLVYTTPGVMVSVILDDPESRPFASLVTLVRTFETWAAEQGIRQYAAAIPESDQHYCRLVERHGGVFLEKSNGWLTYLFPINATRPPNEGMRPWAPHDWRPLRSLMRAFLTEHHAAGGDFLPTRNNVETFIRKGMQAAHAGDPVLIAYDQGQPIGFVLWCSVTSLGLDMAKRILHGFGTYIIPARRREGWSKRLRTRALEIARAAGYDRVDGVALDGRGLAAGKSVGGVVVGAFMQLPIRPASPTKEV